MYKKNLILLIMIFIPTLMLAQYAETIRTGRPGQAIGAFTLGSNVFQVQSGLTYVSFENALDDDFHSYTSNNVFRLGIWEKFEVSGVVGYQISQENPFTGERLSGVSNTQIGARYNILEPNGLIPALGIQGRLLLKLQKEEFRREKLGSQFILSAGNSITDWMGYTANLGLVWDGNGTGAREFYAFNLGFSLTEKIGTFVEVFGSFENSLVNYDAGFSYLVNNDLKLDISGGTQGNNDLDTWFVDAGLSWRFDWRD